MNEEQTAVVCYHLLEGADLKRAYHTTDDQWFFVCEQEHEASQAREIALTAVMETFDLTKGNLIQVPPGYMGNYYGMYWMMKVWEGAGDQVFRPLGD